MSKLHSITDVWSPAPKTIFRNGKYYLHEFWNDNIHIHVFEDHPTNSGMSVTNCIESLIQISQGHARRSEHNFYFERSESSLDFIETVTPTPTWTPVVIEPKYHNTYSYITVLEEFVLGKILAGYEGV